MMCPGGLCVPEAQGRGPQEAPSAGAGQRRGRNRGCGENRGSQPLVSMPEEPPLHPTAAGRSRRTEDGHPEDGGCRRRPGAASVPRPFALGGCLSARLGTRGHHQHPLGAAIPSLLLPSPQGTQGHLPGQQGTGWRDGSRLVFLPASQPVVLAPGFLSLLQPLWKQSTAAF